MGIRGTYLVIPDDCKLVYQGGHHNVYCNGKRHIHTFGGSAHEPIDRTNAMRNTGDTRCPKWCKDKRAGKPISNCSCCGSKLVRQ